MTDEGHDFDFEKSFMRQHQLGTLRNMTGSFQEALMLLQSSRPLIATDDF